MIYGREDTGDILKMRPMFVLVLCESHASALEAYHKWIKYLKVNEPNYISNIQEASMSVEISFIRYVFCDYRLEGVMSGIADSIMYLDDFFRLEGVD